MSNSTRYCRKCLLTDKGDRKTLDQYLSVIHAEDKTDDKTYEERLVVCRGCEQLGEDGTRFSCGCYVEFRAILATGRCPKKYW